MKTLWEKFNNYLDYAKTVLLLIATCFMLLFIFYTIFGMLAYSHEKEVIEEYRQLQRYNH